MTAAIELRHVSYGGAGGLTDINLSVAEGACVAFRGGAGAGRSSLLRLIARMTPPAAGAICLFSRDIWLMSAEEVAQTVLVLSPEDPWLQQQTAWQIATAARHVGDGTSPAARSIAVHMALRHVGLGKGRDIVPGMSEAEWRLRALLAQALVQRPRIVVLAGAQPTDQLRLQLDLLAGLRETGVTIVMSVDPEDWQNGLTERVVDLEGGRITADSAASVARPLPWRMPPADKTASLADDHAMTR